MSRTGFAVRIVAQDLDVEFGRLARRARVFVADALQLGRIDDHVDPFEVSQLAQLQCGERGLQPPAPADDHHFLHAAWAQRFQSVIGDIGNRQHVRVGNQNACDVECDVAITNNNCATARQIGCHLFKVRMRVVPAHEIDGGDTGRQVLTGNVERLIGLRPAGVDHGVVAFGEFGRLDVLADAHVSEEAEAGVFGGLDELIADRLDLGVIRRNPRAHQPPRSRQHLEHVDGQVDLVGRVGGLQQRCCGEETRRSGADDGDMIWTHTRAFCSCRAARKGAEMGRSVAVTECTYWSLDAKALLLGPPPGHSTSAGAPVTWAAVEPDRLADIAALDSTLTTVERVLDVDGLRSRIEKLEHEASDPKLWDDQARAQRVTSELSHTQGELRRVEELRQRLDDLPVLYELAAEEGEGAASGVEALVEADAELKALRADIEATEVRTLLSGEDDEREALVTIRSGAGGVDAADWAEMLMRMYIRWAEQHKYNVEVFDTSYAEEAGIKSTTFAVHTQFAYGTLSVEQGTHRLVRISPFDNQNRRQTSFAEVEVLPVVDTTDHIDIPEGDIRVDVYRSSGPGGQSVNTTDSAVRLTHITTGIVLPCQNEKAQLQNKVSAMRVLQAKLLERKLLEERAELDALKGEGGSSWGNQMRSYVLHPYQMVKDLRTEYEVGNPAAVLDGDIDGFLEAGIRWRNRKDDD